MAFEGALADISAMTDETAEALRARFRSAMDALEIDATALSRRLGKGKDYVRDLLSGRKQTVDAMTMQVLEREVREHAGNRLIPPSPDRHSLVDAGREDDIVVFAAAEGGPGHMIVSPEVIERVTRPWFLKEVRDGYGIEIVGDSMEPVWEAGDTAIINPRLAALRGKDAVFTDDEHGPQASGEWKATIKRLVKYDSVNWTVRQFNEPREFTLSRAEWPKALRIVAKLPAG